MIVKNPVFRQDIGGPWGTVPEHLFEKKELISTLKLPVNMEGVVIATITLISFFIVSLHKHASDSYRIKTKNPPFQAGHFLLW
jgi:hypothetical protein